MEELLNNLIKKGWKPFGKNAIKFSYDGMKTCCGYGAISYLYRDSYVDDNGDKVEYEEWKRQFNLRELVSKESGLLQFVCKNRFLKGPDSTDEWQKNPIGASFDELFYASDYQFYLIESSLKDESELEQFLLDNIKIS